MREQEAATDNDDDDNVVGDWDLDEYLVVGRGVAGNNNQEIATNIEKQKYILDFNDDEGDDTYNDINLAVGEGNAGYNNQEMAAQLEAESTETANSTSSQAPHKEKIGNRDQ